MGTSSPAEVAGLIRTVMDYPTPGIAFRDIAPLLAHGPALEQAVDQLAQPWRNDAVDKVAGIEARGFLLGVPLALALGVGFVPVRKAGKLPGPTVAMSYGLEYGHDVVEVQADAVAPGERVVVVDDVLATGGTAQATAGLINQIGGEVVGFSFLLELAALAGREQLKGHRIEVLVEVND